MMIIIIIIISIIIILIIIIIIILIIDHPDLGEAALVQLKLAKGQQPGNALTSDDDKHDDDEGNNGCYNDRLLE